METVVYRSLRVGLTSRSLVIITVVLLLHFVRVLSLDMSMIIMAVALV